MTYLLNTEVKFQAFNTYLMNANQNISLSANIEQYLNLSDTIIVNEKTVA